jgi:long-subunit fatty acid transport protein
MFFNVKGFFMINYFKSLLSLSMILSLSSLHASGLEFPENGTMATQRGGASVLGIKDATATFLNPSLISRLDGLRISYNHNLIWSDISFERQNSQIPQIGGNGDQTGMGTSSNQASFFPLNGLLAISYKPKDSNLSFGFSIYGPNAGGKAQYPIQGAQRYMITGMDGLLGFAGATIAYGTKNFGFGLTMQYAMMPSFKYQMVVDGQPANDLSPYQSSWDINATIKLSDKFAYSAILGGWYKINKNMDIGFTSRVIPVKFNADGSVEVANTPNNSQFSSEQLKIDHPKASLQMTLPRYLKLGWRYQHLDEATQKTKFDVEFALSYEQWSAVNQFALNLSGEINLLAKQPLSNVTIPKQWRDTMSARLGGSYALLDRLTLSAGMFYEQGASAKEYANLDFPSFNRMGLAGGIAYELTPSFDLLIGYLHILPSSSTVDENKAKVFQQRPLAQCPENCNGYSGVPANAGTISASFQVLTLGINMKFGSK